jgi:hypothetical protein
VDPKEIANNTKSEVSIVFFFGFIIAITSVKDKRMLED